MSNKSEKRKMDGSMATISVVGGRPGGTIDRNTMVEKELLRQAIMMTGINFMSSYSQSAWGLKDDIPYCPHISPNVLLDDVVNDPVLSHCINFKSKTVGGLGYTLKMFDQKVEKEELLEQQRRDFDEVCKTLFFPSLNQVTTRSCYDYEYSGMGGLLVDTNLKPMGNAEYNYFGKNYSVTHREAVRVRHINRMKISVLQPRLGSKGEIKPGYELDLVFPRMFVAQDIKGFFAKSFGDPRDIDRTTGEVLSRGNKNLAPMIYRFVQYYPHDEAYGFPSWRSAKIDIDTLYDIRLCDHFYFRGNGVPNMVFIVPDVKTEAGRGADEIVQEFLTETAEQRMVLGGQAQRRAIVMSVPTKSIHQSSGKFPIMIKEIKGEPPGSNIELRNELNQSIVNANELPANLVVPYTKAVGSGKDKQEDLRHYKEFYAEPLRRMFNAEFFDRLFARHTKHKNWTAHLSEIDTSDKAQEAMIAKVWDGINALNNGEKREKMGTTKQINPDSEDKSKEFNGLVFVDFNKVPWDWENMERPDMRLKDMEQSLSDMEQQLQDAQAGVATEEARRFMAMCEDHGVPIEYLTDNVIPAIKKYVQDRRKP